MGAYTDGAKIIVSLGTTGRFAGSGDTTAALASLGTTGGLMASYAVKNTGYFSETTKKAYNAGTEWLQMALDTISVLELLLGLAGPDKGDKFTIASMTFDDVGTDLLAANPDDSWQGNASVVYACDNTDQYDAVQKMVAGDKAMAAVLKLEAAQVMDARRQVMMVKSGLTAAMPVALALYVIPVYGPALSMAFQIATSLSGMGEVMRQLTLKAMSSSDNANTVGSIVENYYLSVSKSIAV